MSWPESKARGALLARYVPTWGYLATQAKSSAGGQFSERVIASLPRNRNLIRLTPCKKLVSTWKRKAASRLLRSFVEDKLCALVIRSGAFPHLKPLQPGTGVIRIVGVSQSYENDNNWKLPKNRKLCKLLFERSTTAPTFPERLQNKEARSQFTPSVH